MLYIEYMESIKSVNKINDMMIESNKKSHKLKPKKHDFKRLIL